MGREGRILGRPRLRVVCGHLSDATSHRHVKRPPTWSFDDQHRACAASAALSAEHCARPCAAPASTATAAFASLMRAAGQGSPSVSSIGSVGQAEWLAQAPRRPDIEAAMAQVHIALRSPSSPASRTGRCQSGTAAKLPKSRDCNAADGLSQTDESICAQANEIDRSNRQRQDPLARHDDACGRGLVYGATVHCVPAVAAPPRRVAAGVDRVAFLPIVSASLTSAPCARRAQAVLPPLRR